MSIVKPKYLAGTSKGCGLESCHSEIPLAHQFCQRHFNLLPEGMRHKLAVAIQAARTVKTDRVNALRDYVRTCAEYVRVAEQAEWDAR